ncbi:TPA: hypothetical protein ACTZ5N_004674 [Bacillus cereus]
MKEGEDRDMNRFVRIVLISIMMSIIWFAIQEVIRITLNNQIHDMLMGTICFVSVYLFYDKLGLK